MSEKHGVLVDVTLLLVHCYSRDQYLGSFSLH